MRLLLSAALLVSILAGCASTKEEIIPNTGPTMLEIYREHQQRTGSAASTAMPSASEPIKDAGFVSAGWRTETDALDQQFARLPNPDLVMYVFPHLSNAGTPVPGYVTVFPMYERVEYALPGEVSPREQRLQRGGGRF